MNKIKINMINKNNLLLWLVQLSGLRACCEPKDHLFNSQAGHMPGLWARSPVESAHKATTY